MLDRSFHHALAVRRKLLHLAPNLARLLPLLRSQVLESVLAVQHL